MTDSPDAGPEPREPSPRRRSTYAETRVRPEAMPSKNVNVARAACLGAALIGALVWGAISYFANRELGLVAWGIGGLVGGACAVVGGRGSQMAVTAAIFAIVSIVSGKVLSQTWQYSSPEVRAMYEEAFVDSRDWNALGDDPSDAVVKEYIASHGYIGVDVLTFREEHAPGVSVFAKEYPTFDDFVAYLKSEVSIWDGIIADFHFLDLVFAGLGIATAYGLVMRASQADANAIQRSLRAEAAGGAED